MPRKTTKWDAYEYLGSPEAIAAYIEAAFEDGDPGVITLALGNVARAKGMSQVARESGVARPSLYKTLTPEGDPRLSTLLAVMRALGVGLTAEKLENS